MQQLKIQKAGEAVALQLVFDILKKDTAGKGDSEFPHLQYYGNENDKIELLASGKPKNKKVEDRDNEILEGIRGQPFFFWYPPLDQNGLVTDFKKKIEK